MSSDGKSGTFCPNCGARVGLEGRVCARCAFADLVSSPVDEQSAGLFSLHDIPVPGEKVAYVGDYEIIQILGNGGMGLVYRARQQSLNRQVALKMLLAGAYARDDFKARFRQEAEAVARLQHPNIVSIYEIGEHEGQQYFSMQLVDGGGLDQQIAGGQWKVTPGNARDCQLRVAELMATVARAVHHAHEHGVIHRDLKPSNILFDRQGKPMVADFGLAKLTEKNSELTQSGEPMGSPCYMAPEQAAGKVREISTATDVWALGVILYELLTGVRAFQGESAMEIMQCVMRNEPEGPRACNPMVNRDLEVICLKCLEKDPRNRYRNAEEVAADLERWRAGVPILARPSTALGRLVKWTKRNRAYAALLGGILVLFLIITVATPAALSRISAARRAELKKSDEARESERIASDASLRGARAQSWADFRTAEKLVEAGDTAGGLAFLARAVRTDEQNEVAAVRLVSLLSERSWPLAKVLNHGGEVIDGEFSPDGRRVITSSANGTARLWDVNTGRPVAAPLAHTSSVVFARFTMAGRQVVTVAGTVAQRWDARDGRAVGGALAHGGKIRAVSISPDRRNLAVGSDDHHVRIWDLEQGILIRSFQHADRISCVEFSPDSRKLFTSDLTRQGRIWDLDSGTETVRGMRSPGGRSISARFTADGTRLVLGSGDTESKVSLWDANAGATLQGVLSGDHVGKAFVSPDGEWIVTARMNRSTATLWNVATGEKRYEFAHHGAITMIELSPEAQRVVTASDDKTACIWSTLTGLRVCEPLQHDGKVLVARFAPDGKQVLTCSDDGTAKIWQVADGRWNQPEIRHQTVVQQARFNSKGTIVLTTSHDGTARLSDATTGLQIREFVGHSKKVKEARFSPDERFIVTGATDGTVRLWDVNSAENLWTVQTESESVRPVFDSGGSRIAACGYSSSKVVLLDAASGSQLVEPLQGDNVTFTADFSPDGQSLLVAQWAASALMFDVATGKRRPDRFNHNGRESSVGYARYSPDGKLVATASSDHVAFVRYADTAKPFAGPFKHEAEINGLEFSTDSKALLTYASDRTARIWPLNYPSGRPVQLRHDGVIKKGKFCHDNRELITVGADNTARLWDVATGEALSAPFVHPNQLQYVEFNPATSRFVTACDDGIARIFDLPPRVRKTPPWLAELAELTACWRIETNGARMPVVNDPSELSRLVSRIDSPDWIGSPLARWTRWFLADRHERGLTDGSKLTVREWILQRVRPGQGEVSVLQAVVRYPEHPLALAGLSKFRNSPEAERLTSLAQNLAPNDPDVNAIIRAAEQDRSRLGEDGRTEGLKKSAR